MLLKKILLLLLCLNLFGTPYAGITKGALGAKISLELININTRDLLKLITEHSSKSVIISEKINGKITVNLRDILWHEALDSVLQMQGLIKHETSSVIMIEKADELNKNEQAMLRPKVFNLRYVSADNISKLLKPAGVLSTYGKSGVESATNSLVVADTDDKVGSIKRLLDQIDVPAKQVLIEARIVSADENFVRELGIDLNGYHGYSADGGALKKVATIGRQKSQFNFAVAKFGMGNLLDLELAALENEGRGRVISKPKLLTTDRQSAYIEAGSEVPYQEKNKEGNTSVSFKKAVLSLKVIPEVVEKNLINLSLELNQDKVGQLVVNGVPTIDTRKIHTQVLVHDNETVVLGGIYEWSKLHNTSCVPIINKIPFLNLLLRKNEVKMERKELLIFVTPKIIQ